MIILTIIVVGCSARDIELWKEAHEDRIERGERCYEKANGTFYCEDKYGNRVY
jgi:hypothetical protein